jgi:hypothetical protein
LLPYQGFGSGIQRALDAWPEIDFTDDRDGCLFTATVHRNEKTSLKFFIKEWSCQTYHKILTRMICSPLTGYFRDNLTESKIRFALKTNYLRTKWCLCYP